MRGDNIVPMFPGGQTPGTAPYPPTGPDPALVADFRLGEWIVRPSLNRLQRGDEQLAIEPKLMQLLVFLADQPGVVQVKDAIFDAVWAKQYIADSALTRAIAELRRALGDDAQSPRYIETIPRRGYRLVASVEPLGEPVAASASAAVASSGRRRRRWVLAAIAASALSFGVAATGIWWSASRPPPIRRLAVLPLADLSPEGADVHLVDGMTEALITDLAGIPALRVVSRRSADLFAGGAHPIRQVAEQLGVDTVVEGSLWQQGDRVRINVKLTNARTDTHFWARSFERSTGDLLALQAEVALAIAGEVRAALGRGTAVTAAAKVPAAADTEAQEAYVRGRSRLRECILAGPNEAEGLFTEAIRRAPGWAAPYAGLADYYNRLAFFEHVPPTEGYPKARRAALDALVLDDGLAEAHAALGTVYALHDWDWRAGAAELERAIELNPSAVIVLQQYAIVEMVQGHFDEAVALSRRAIELDPLSPETAELLGWVLFNSRRYEEALVQLERVAEMQGRDSVYRAWTLIFLGRAEEAIDHLASRLPPGRPRVINRAVYSWALSSVGRFDEAREQLRVIEQAPTEEYRKVYPRAIAAAGLGDVALALDLLEQAYEERSVNITYLETEPFLDPLRGEPRFRSLLRRVGFAG